MMKSEEETRQAYIDVIDALINDHKKNISLFEIMKEHINDMSSEQFKHFAFVFSMAMSKDLIQRTLQTYSTICATNDTIEHIKEELK